MYFRVHTLCKSEECKFTSRSDKIAYCEILNSKTVLLRDRKRRTTRAPSLFLSSRSKFFCWGAGGPPGPNFFWGGGGVPSRSKFGGGRGTLQVPIWGGGYPQGPNFWGGGRGWVPSRAKFSGGQGRVPSRSKFPGGGGRRGWAGYPQGPNLGGGRAGYPQGPNFRGGGQGTLHVQIFRGGQAGRGVPSRSKFSGGRGGAGYPPSQNFRGVGRVGRGTLKVQIFGGVPHPAPFPPPPRGQTK